VTCYYFHVWDEASGPAFVKVCAYFPYPGKIWVNGQYAERPAMPHRVGAGLVGEPPTGVATDTGCTRISRVAS
jgi:hypothetical protein